MIRQLFDYMHSCMHTMPVMHTKIRPIEGGVGVMRRLPRVECDMLWALCSCILDF